MSVPKHSGCFYCGNQSQEFLKSIVKQTINLKGNVESHTMGQCLCDNCVGLPILDMRIPFADRRKETK